MTQETPSEKNPVQDYIKAHGFGLSSPDRAVRSPITRTGNAVKDYILACGYGLSKKTEV
jgi:hypothetical protein